jgi:hypothetical protein
MRGEDAGQQFEGLISGGGGDPFFHQHISTFTVFNQDFYEMIIAGFPPGSRASRA